MMTTTVRITIITTMTATAIPIVNLISMGSLGLRIGRSVAVSLVIGNLSSVPIPSESVAG